MKTYESFCSWKCCSKNLRRFSVATISSPTARPCSHLPYFSWYLRALGETWILQGVGFRFCVFLLICLGLEDVVRCVHIVMRECLRAFTNIPTICQQILSDGDWDFVDLSVDPEEVVSPKSFYCFERQLEKAHVAPTDEIAKERASGLIEWAQSLRCIRKTYKFEWLRDELE